ncbi:MAG: N-6 DNA methylase [Rubrobacter sp.]|nr:N-6 DNA methylase [Rubrobacter sp.]
MATFDGGLFDAQRHPFLEENAVGDHPLQLAVDKLSRVGGQFVDYRDLAERHLGTIYEGLLEYHLEALPEPEDGWTVVLLNEKGERRLTGAYYTPDFVVKHIVEKTIGPMLDEAVAGAKDDEEKIACVLGLDVLDPSMGSGHFLVEATEYIARFLVELDVSGGEYSDEGEAELAHWKRRVAQSCVYGVDLNPLAVDLAKLSLWLATVAKDRPLSFLDHHLRCGNSLVGSRISELEPGGGRKKRKKKADDSSQLSMLEDDSFRLSMGNAVGSMWLIEESPADTVEEVREQERLYEMLRADLVRRYAKLADLAAATSFGVDVDASLWKPLADYAAKPSAATLPQFQRWLDEARDVAGERRFFHWELEFPEVFFDRHGRPLGDDSGFDAVVGNPPYVRQEVLGREMKGYFEAAFPETYHGVADLFVYFYEQGFRHLRRGGRMGYIVTNKWLRAGFGEPLRGYSAGSGAVEEIVDFGHAPIFPDADVFPCILILHKPRDGSTANDSVRVAEFPREALGTSGIEEYAAEHGHTVPKSRFTNAAWSLETSDVDDLMAKLRRNGVPLAEFAGVKPAYGIKTGLNEAFLVDTETRDRLVREDGRSAEIIKPYLRGQDIKRWSPEWRGLWMIVMKSSGDHAWPWSEAAKDSDEAEEIFRKTFPAIHAHMKPLEARLRKRSDRGRFWWELRSCDYYALFKRPKIVYQVLQTYPRYGFDTDGLLLNDKGFCLPTDDAYLLAVLNSSLVWWHNWRYLPRMINDTLTPLGVLMEKLPIAVPTDEAREEAEGIVGELIAAAKAGGEMKRRALDWLAIEFGVEKPGKKLEDIAALDADDFIAEVRKRRPKPEGRLTPGALGDLRSGYEELAAPAKEARRRSTLLERRLTDLVNRAYGLTEEEIRLMWSTTPPRMPGV